MDNVPIKPVISTRKISKEFSGVSVLKNIDFDLFPGEIHALVGENGAGKSTLMNIMCGVHQPTKGEVLFNGEPADIGSPIKARDLGIVLIHQEPLTFPDLNVTENIFAGYTRQTSKTFIHWKKNYETAKQLLSSMDIQFSERASVKNMSIADQQMMEIVSALVRDAKVIVMDEPTASVTSEEVKVLFKIMNLLKAQGRAIVFISHKLDEIKEISDRVTVLRDGEHIKTCKTEELTIDQIIQLMIGRTINEQIEKEEAPIGESMLRLHNLCLPGVFKDISLEVHRGEIVGIAGLVGSGRSEVANAIFGITPPASGSIFVKNRQVKITCPAEAIKNKIAYVPEDRQRLGLFPLFSVSSNIIAAISRRVSRFGLLQRSKEKEHINRSIDKLAIKLRNPAQEVRQLSGGNQQKVVISKWMLTEPEILILDEPTRGIDVGAKAEVYRIIGEMASSGKAILMISSEMPEILGLSDNVFVMNRGRIVAQFGRFEMTDEIIMTAAAGRINER